VRRWLAEAGQRRGARLIWASATGLAVLAAATFYVSYRAQFTFMFGVKHQFAPALIEALIARTSQEQWATEPHVSDPAPGDLVFFPGADGTASAPGHVGLVVDPTRDLMIDAYAPGVPVHEETYGQPGSAPGLQDPVGFTDPSGGP